MQVSTEEMVVHGEVRQGQACPSKKNEVVMMTAWTMGS